MDNNKKIETVINQTLKECENNGLTISEALQLPLLLKQKLDDTISAHHKNHRFEIT